jgi:IS5 family transposase
MPRKRPVKKTLTLEESLEERHKHLLAQKKFLECLNQVIDWNIFLPTLKKAFNREPKLGQESGGPGKSGRPPFDEGFMFKILVLQSFYNLSDEETEYQIRDRLSFMHFLGLSMRDTVPDARTIWLFREGLKKAGAIKQLFDDLALHLDGAGLRPSGGQIIDATFVQVPHRHKKKEPAEKQDILLEKKPLTPEEERHRAKCLAHRDDDATWTMKRKKAFFGFKSHIATDLEHKIIRSYCVTTAKDHDSLAMDELLLDPTVAKDVWADSAYRSEKREKELKEKGYTSHIHERAYRNRPLTDAQNEANKEKSRIRTRVEHTFGHMKNSMGGLFTRTIGMARAVAKIGLKNIAYNLYRCVLLKGRKTTVAC